MIFDECILRSRAIAAFVFSRVKSFDKMRMKPLNSGCCRRSSASGLFLCIRRNWVCLCWLRAFAICRWCWRLVFAVWNSCWRRVCAIRSSCWHRVFAIPAASGKLQSCIKNKSGQKFVPSQVLKTLKKLSEIKKNIQAWPQKFFISTTNILLTNRSLRIEIHQEFGDVTHSTSSQPQKEQHCASNQQTNSPKKFLFPTID